MTSFGRRQGYFTFTWTLERPVSHILSINETIFSSLINVFQYAGSTAASGAYLNPVASYSQFITGMYGIFVRENAFITVSYEYFIRKTKKS